MSEPKIMYRYHLRFCKKDTAVWISHLDMVRTFSRLFQRAGIPIWYTEGFNPHPKIVFAVPLPLGVESNTELLEFKLDKPMSSEIIRQKLSEVAPLGLDVISVSEASYKFSEIEYAEYLFLINGHKTEDVLRVIHEFFAKTEVLILKKTKSGEKVKDIKPSVAQISVHDNCLRAFLSVNSDFFLGPDLFLQAFNEVAATCGVSAVVPERIVRNALTGKSLDKYY